MFNFSGLREKCQLLLFGWLLFYLPPALAAEPSQYTYVVWDQLQGVIQRDYAYPVPVIPFLQKRIAYISSPQTHHHEPIEARSQDGQNLMVTLSYDYQPLQHEVWQIHQEIGPDYLSKIIQPSVRSAIRTVFADYPHDNYVHRVPPRQHPDYAALTSPAVSEAAERRANNIQRRLLSAINQQIIPYHLQLTRLQIPQLAFSEELQQAYKHAGWKIYPVFSTPAAQSPELVPTPEGQTAP